jgi:ketosteroid isomerase-like protein
VRRESLKGGIMKTWTVTCAALILFGETMAVSARRSAEVPAQKASAGDLRKEIDAFNARFLEAHRKMDDAAILGMWAEDGVSLLPETAPMVGKAAITKFLTGVTGQLKGWRMEKMELDFQGIEVGGDWASEWALEHQVVRPPDDRPVFDGRGKMLLVLHREADGNWKVKREMWNQGMKP